MSLTSGIKIGAIIKFENAYGDIVIPYKVKEIADGVFEGMNNVRIICKRRQLNL